MTIVGFAWKYCKYCRCSSFRKLSMKSSSVNWPSASMFLMHSIPITLFLRPCEQLFWPRFQALGWWNVLGICFRFGRPCMAVPEQANRSDENIMFPSFPLRYCWSFPLLLVRVGLGFRVTILSFWSSTKLNLGSVFSWLLMLHSSVRTHVARTPSFLSLFITNYFGYCVVYTDHFHNSVRSANLVMWVRTNDNSNVGSVLTLFSVFVLLFVCKCSQRRFF
jgi:hypothetical protein